MNPQEVGALLASGRAREALSAAAQFARDNPHDPVGWNTFGAVLIETGQPEPGERALREALRLLPGFREAAFNLAIALRKQGKGGEALDQLAWIVERWPTMDALEAELAAVGVTLLMRGDAASAERAFRTHLRVNPVSRAAHQNLALALLAQDRADDAIAALEAALAAGHRDAEILAMLVNAKGQACDWNRLDERIDELRRAARDPGTRPASPQTAQYLPQVGAAEQRAWAERYVEAKLPKPAPANRAARNGDGRLRVGYLSADFHDHAVAWLVIGLLENHDRSRFAVHAFSAGRPDASPMRARIAKAVDSFVDVSTLDAVTAAARIAGEGIDILIDLGGHTRGARLDILAARPAPVQGHFLGYPGTTGARFVDFFVCDGVAAPPGAESAFTERLVRLPRCCLPTDPTLAAPVPASRESLGIEPGAILLCSFNQAVKLRPDVFAAWCGLLRDIPRGVLMLRDPGAGARERLRAFASGRGIDAARIVFAPHAPAREQHLARLAACDIALDTFPYGSHTNAADALACGVPLVTAFGETMASRVGASLLTHARLGDWAFDTLPAAIAKVKEIVSTPESLALARRRAAGARSSALFDMHGFARDFEAMLARLAA